MKRIMIVDDNEENLYLLRVLLEGHGYQVELARNGSEALTRSLESPPDMIISDILMPVMDGFTLCSKWKADERLKLVPFIFYTATYTDPKDEQLAIDMGADAFLVKPTEPDEFLRRMETILSLDKENKPVLPQIPKTSSESLFRNYNEVLIRKLEQKMLELEKVNRKLETEIMEKNKIETTLRESEEQYRTLADSGQALIWTSGLDKKCNYFNRPWLNFTGRTLQMELGDGWAEGVHPDDLEQCFKIYSSAFDRREPFSMVYRLRRHDGVYRWIQDDGTPRYDFTGNFLGYLGHCLDITERKLGEEKLEKLYADLELIVARRTSDLEKANQELEAFSYTVSHDLRAPLRHIKGFLDMFQSEMGEITNAKANHYIELINDSTKLLGNLIDDLLSFSRIGKAELSMNTVDMNAAAKEALSTFSEDIARRAIHVDLHQLPPAHGDFPLLRVVLTNLISNAVKFTAKTGRARIEIGSCSIKNDLVYFVRDNGAGFDMRFSDKLFGVFQRLHGESDFEGTGIGLATVKRIINRHYGRVWAEGAPGKGACFFFSLPPAG